MKNIKHLTKTKIPILFLGILLFFTARSYGQCSISTSGSACVDEPILFNCNSVGASSFNWDFNSEGSNTSQCNPSFKFTTPGVKNIKLELTLPNGQKCNASLNINVIPKPIINVKRIVNKTQCFANNSFCFTDSSMSGVLNGKICRTTIVFDDNVKYEFSGNGPRNFCHTFQDPAGGTYGMTIEIEDCNGCLKKVYVPTVAVVQPSLGLSFTSPQPKKCDSVQLCVTNKSLIPLDSISSFEWDWGDGKKDIGNKNTPSLWNANINNGVCHWFKTQGPNLGNFNTTLTVTSNFGCKESFVFKSSATNLIIKPIVLSDYDSLCFADGTFSFRLKDGPVPQGANPLFIFGDPPSGALNTTSQWSGTHKFTSIGPYKINFSFTHAIPGCGRTVFDTVLVIGPQSLIEGPSNLGMRFIEDYQRYQCVIEDTVHFYNFSKFFHNDKIKSDDDSVFVVYDSVMVFKSNKQPVGSGVTFDPNLHNWVYPGFNSPLVHAFGGAAPNFQTSLTALNQKRGNDCTIRIWDFDDDYCERCTTDTKNGINVGKNCKFSKDSLPSHWYTPWDSLYQTRFSLIPESVLDFNEDSGICNQKMMWSCDSVAIIRDTILYYGNNNLANKTKDSIIYAGIKNKQMVNNQITGPAKLDITLATRFYLQAGDTVYIDFKNGLPPNRFVGPRYLTVQPGNTLVINNKTDKALYHVWLNLIQDTIPLNLIQPWHKIIKKERVFGFKTGDSINLSAHRNKFFTGPLVRCMIVKLLHKDICHPLACENLHSISLALMPPSAKKLRKVGTQCLGGDQDNYGITFVLDDTKPGCTRSWAEINFDTALNKTGWVPAIGANLTQGGISTGGLPPVNPPYAITGDYQLNGPAPSRFSKQFTVDDIKDSITGYINVGLIVGNGMWPSSGSDYPESCRDTVYYEKFARFPIMDNRFRIVKPKEGPEFTKICRKDTISLTTLVRNRTYLPDVDEATWSLTGANVGKYFNQYYVLSVNEKYNRFVQIHKDTPYLVDMLQVVKRSFFDGVTSTLDSTNIRIAKVEKWHTEADITPVFDVIKRILEAQKIDIYELSPAQLSMLIWNGVGTIGKPYTGARGCLDTTGFGRFIRFYKVADQKQILHERDTTLRPIEKIVGFDGQTYSAYNFVPQYSGYYIANFGLRSIAPENCTKSTGTAKKVIVGFYGEMKYEDTILCHGQQVISSPEFRYFEVYPETAFRLLDPRDYWRDRIAEAGNINREGITIHDLNKKDDGLDPKSTFGGFPWSITGLDNAPNKQLVMSGNVGSIYYNKDTGDVYLIRTAASDSFGCKDTFPQNIYITAVRAKFKLDQQRPNCNAIIELFDSSYLIDPCKNKFGANCDEIVKWTVNWGDKKSNSVSSYFNSLPSSIAHSYTRNGRFMVKWRVETKLGCISWDSTEVYIPGPEPFFDTLIPRTYCVGEKVDFKNLSKYLRADSSLWSWEFGDGFYGNQYDTITGSNDTMNHVYKKPGRFKVTLYHYFKLKVGSSIQSCSVQYPDPSFGENEFYLDIIPYDSVDLLSDKIAICPGDSIKFRGVLKPENRYSNYKWNFGLSPSDTLVSKDTSVTRSYSLKGKYTVRFMGDVNSASNPHKLCPSSDSIVIEVGDVKADFEIDSTKEPLFCFNNTSVNSTSNRWSFYNPVDIKTLTPANRVFIENGNTADYNKPQICEDYRDSLGSYWVCLEATNDIGCKDTICKRMYNNFKATIRPPNVFTPDGTFDGTDPQGLKGNEVFNIYIEGEEMYELVIYDRWGVKVFESNDANIDWNGKVNNTGALCPDGTYFFILKYRFKGKDNDEPVLNGIVRIIR